MRSQKEWLEASPNEHKSRTMGQCLQYVFGHVVMARMLMRKLEHIRAHRPRRTLRGVE